MAWIEKDTPVCSLKDRKEEKKGREGRKEGNKLLMVLTNMLADVKCDI